METGKGRPPRDRRVSPAVPVLTWSVPRNKAVPDSAAGEIPKSGPPDPLPGFLTPLSAFHRAWRSFVASFVWLLKLKEADSLFLNIPPYFVDRTLKGRTAEVGGLLTWGRFWKLGSEGRRGMGVGSLILIHKAGLAAYGAKGRRSLRLAFVRLKDFVTERAMHLLILLVGAPVILSVEKTGFLGQILTVVLVAAVAVRLPGWAVRLVEVSPGARTWLKSFRTRRRQRTEAREVEEARGLLAKTLQSSKTLFIPWASVVEASFALDSSFRQIMIYGPPAALWTLTWETREGGRESAVLSAPVRTMGYPSLGFADLRLNQELEQAPLGSVRSELPLFAGIPGMEEWIRGRGGL